MIEIISMIIFLFEGSIKTDATTIDIGDTTAADTITSASTSLSKTWSFLNYHN